MARTHNKYPKDTKVLSYIENQILSILTTPSLLSEIQHLAALPRSTTEYNLRKLELKRLVKKQLKGKRTLYVKTNHVSQPIDTLPYPVLTLPGITIYKGKEAIENVWREIIEKAPESRLIGIQPRKSFDEAIRKSPKNIVQSISQGIGDKRFIVDAIVHENLAHSLFKQYNQEAKVVAKAFTGRLEDMVKVPNDFLDEKAEFFLIDNQIFIMDWYKEFAIKISNKNIFNLFVSVFYAVKAHGKRYEQGKLAESLITKLDKKYPRK